MIERFYEAEPSNGRMPSAIACGAIYGLAKLKGYPVSMSHLEFAAMDSRGHRRGLSDCTISVAYREVALALNSASEGHATGEQGMFP